MTSKRVPHQTLVAALATPEEDVSKPARARPASAITQIAALQIGECWSRVQAAHPDVKLKDFARDSSTWRDELRNTVQSSVRHAKMKTGGTYVVETGDFISSGRNIFLVAVVTRIG